MKRPPTIVVGAGPVGVVAALAAAQKGFSVTLLEAESVVDDSPRAATTHPATLEMIDRLGLIDQFIAEGLVARYFQFWDRPTRTRICEFDHDLLRDETKFPFVVQTEQHKLANMGIARLRTWADVAVRFDARVTAVRQDASGVTVTVEGASGKEQISGDYLIGADGGRSTVRQVLEIEFEGYTWPERFCVLTTLNDFQQMFGCCYRNYFADPYEWVNLFKVAGDDLKGRWRAVFPVRTDETDEQALSDATVHARLQKVFPMAEPYQVAHRNLYRAHQRVAAKFRVGRVFLAGDSVHVNNPIGGLGLNCGIHDAMELVDTLHLVVRALDGPVQNRTASETLGMLRCFLAQNLGIQILKCVRPAACLGFAVGLCSASPAWAQTIGGAASFAIVGGSGVTAGGAVSTVNGNVGSPGAINGFPGNAIILPPFVNHGNDGLTITAVADLLTLYNSAVMAPGGATSIGPGVNDLSLGTSTGVPGRYTPGRYTNAAGGVALLTTSITLDTPGIYVFTVANQLTAVGNVLLGVGVNPCSVFWRTGNGAAPTSISGIFVGTVVSDGTIAVNPGATVAGRLLTTATGPVTLAGGNTIGGCGGAPPVAPSFTKAFSPGGTSTSQNSILTITFTNTNAAAATLTAAFVDNFPVGLVISESPNASSTCGGTVTAVPGGNLLALGVAGSAIPAAGSCVVSVNVLSTTPGTYVNSVPAGRLQTSAGNFNTIVQGTLIVAADVPTLPQWAMIALTALLALAGYAAVRRRTA